MKVCVVGATGVLGRFLVPLLLEEGFTVRALARFTPEKRAWLPKETDCITFDLLADAAPRELEKLVRGFDAVLHIATAIPHDFTAPGAWDLNNRIRTTGTEILLQSALNNGVKYYVQQSITMRYPDLGDEWIDEDTPLVATSQQAGRTDTVTIMEDLVKSVDEKKMDWCILRGGTFVGPGTFQDDAVRRLKQGKEVVPGDGMEYVSFVHVADVALAFLQALRIKPHHGIYNIVSEPIRNGEYRDRLADLLHVDRPARDASQPRPASNRCSNKRAATGLQWKPQHSIFPSA